jgi:diguanylate cyclase (GGDEF)-like protein
VPKTQVLVVQQVFRAKRTNLHEKYDYPGTDPFLVAVVDIDHFKQINDAHGHLAGDRVLQAVAKQLQGALRKGDYLARFGGEEFVLLMMSAGSEAARTSCDRLRTRVEELRIDELGSRRITVSIGGSFYRPRDTQVSLLERADTAMYRAKSNGRNRTELETW